MQSNQFLSLFRYRDIIDTVVYMTAGLLLAVGSLVRLVFLYLH